MCHPTITITIPQIIVLLKIIVWKLIFQHAIKPECTFLTKEMCWQVDYGFIYLFILLLANICRFKDRGRFFGFEDFAGAWAAESRFSQLLSLYWIKVACVRYMGSANIRYGNFHCPMPLFSLWGQNTSVGPHWHLFLSTSTLTPPNPTNVTVV